jgi:CheY-like chemotaxis protein
MKLFENYVLVLEQQPDDLHTLKSLLHALRCPVVTAQSMEQALASIRHYPPALVILAGSCQNWSPPRIQQLRSQVNGTPVMVVALTDVSAPSWQHLEEHPDLDGFLVKPLTMDVLTSLLQSAQIRQTYCLA